jgi:hypothetical protein
MVMSSSAVCSVSLFSGANLMSLGGRASYLCESESARSGQTGGSEGGRIVRRLKVRVKPFCRLKP